MAWKLAHCVWRETARLNSYLEASWEPFAVSETEDGTTVWLRRSAEPKDAKVEDLPRRPRYEPEVA